MTPEQQALLDKAKRSLEAAQSLVQKGFYEFAVSRAYLCHIKKASLSLAMLPLLAHLDNTHPSWQSSQ
jgi:uncharacterized protein (UPF0332 family)